MNKQKLIRDIIVEALKKDPYILSPPYSRGIKERPMVGNSKYLSG